MIEVSRNDEWFPENLSEFVGKEVTLVWEDALELADGTYLIFLPFGYDTHSEVKPNNFKVGSAKIQEIWVDGNTLYFHPVASVQLPEPPTGTPEDYGLEVEVDKG